jgi:hypothetical protein
MSESIYLSVKQAPTVKAGKHSKGKISYRVLTDELHEELFITIVGNEGGGWFSNEIIAVSKIEDVLSKINTKIPLATKAFAPAFESKSVNNAGFLVAVLRAEGLLKAADEGSRLHSVTQEWELWKSMMLTEPGEVYVPPVAKGIASAAEKIVPEQHVSRQPLTLKNSKKANRNAIGEAVNATVVGGDAAEDEIDATEAENNDILNCI